MSAKEYDIVIVGLGIRGMAFLAKNQEILKYKILVINKGENIGVGKLGDYIVNSHSDCCNLLSYFASPFFNNGKNKKLNKLLETKAPVLLTEIKDVLAYCGKKIRNYIGSQNILNDEVKKIKDNADKYELTTKKNGVIGCKMVILSTGMRESLSPPLKAFENKTVLSGYFLTKKNWEKNVDLIRNAKDQKIVIWGGAHSAFSSLEVLLRISDKLKIRPEVLILHRNSFIVRYEDIKEAKLYENTQFFRGIQDPKKSICRHSGKVFRQNGLKGEAKNIAIKLSQGKLGNIKNIETSDIKVLKEVFSSAGTIIQAIGYNSNLPNLDIKNKKNTNYSYAKIGESIHGETPFESFFTVRIARTPMGDNRPDTEDIYQKIGNRVFREIKKLALRKIR